MTITITFTQFMGAIISIAFIILGLLRYQFSLFEKHTKNNTKTHVDSINKRFEEHKDKFSDHKEKLDLHEKTIKENAELLRITRENYVKTERLDEFKNWFTKVFTRLDTMSEDLHELIGAHNNKITKKKNDE